MEGKKMSGVNVAAHRRNGYGLEREQGEPTLTNKQVIDVVVGQILSEEVVAQPEALGKRGAVLVLNLDHGTELSRLATNPDVPGIRERFGKLLPVFLPPDDKGRADVIKYTLATKGRPVDFLFPDDPGFDEAACYARIVAQRAAIPIRVIRVGIRQGGGN